MLGGNGNGPPAAGSPSLQRTVWYTHGLFCLPGLECPTLYRTQSPSSPAELRQLLDCGESLHGTVKEDKLTFLFQMARPHPHPHNTLSLKGVLKACTVSSAQ